MDFFKKQASSFLSSQDEPTKAKTKEEPPKHQGEETKSEKTEKGETPGYSELFGSANVLLDAAKGQFGGNKDGAGKVDTAKVADAAEDVLQAASHYGKFEGTQYEGYVKKAEDYLETYKSRDVAPPGEELKKPAEELKKSAEEVKASAPEPPKAEATKSTEAE